MAESGDPELSDESAHLSLWAGGTSVGVARGNGPYRAPDNNVEDAPANAIGNRAMSYASARSGQCAGNSRGERVAVPTFPSGSGEHVRAVLGGLSRPPGPAICAGGLLDQVATLVSWM